MQTIYVPELSALGQRHQLAGDEARHAVQVMRLTEGAEVRSSMAMVSQLQAVWCWCRVRRVEVEAVASADLLQISGQPSVWPLHHQKAIVWKVCCGP